MTGLMVATVVCLTMICLAAMTVAGFLVWWTMDSAGQHSISAGRQTTLAMETLKEASGQTAQVVGLVTNLTELVILGRPMPPTGQPVETPSPSATPLSPDELWRGLPDNALQALIREQEEDQAAQGTWPDPSETLLHGYEQEGDLP